MTKRELYDKVVELTSELQKTNIAQRIFDAAMEKDALKAQVIIDAFPEYYPKLYEKITDFGEKFNSLVEKFKVGEWHNPAIFGKKTDEKNEMFVFDPQVIDALSFYIFSLLAKFSNFYIFDDEACDYSWGDSVESFINAIRNNTNNKLAKFVGTFDSVEWIGENGKYKTVGELLVAILYELDYLNK